jgi:hypothetical protein
MRGVIIIFIFIFYASCSIKPLGYFSVEPYAKPMEKTISEPFYIVLGDYVKNDFVVSGEGFKKMSISNFRYSVRQSLYNTFSKTLKI